MEHRREPDCTSETWFDKAYRILGYISLFLIGVCLLFFVIQHFRVPTPAPERCALCENGDRLRYHAPCLVNLATGEVGELAVYDPDPVQAGEIAATQTTGVMRWSFCAGLSAICNTDARTCSAILSEPQPLDPSHFCEDCRATLESVATDGYVLADLYAKDTMQLYPVTPGAEYTIRDYTVSITENAESNRSTVLVTGHV